MNDLRRVRYMKRKRHVSGGGEVRFENVVKQS